MSDPLSHRSPAIAYSCFIKVSLLAAPHVPAWHAYLHTHRHTYTCLVAIYLSCQLDLAAYLFNLFLTWMDTHIHTLTHHPPPLHLYSPTLLPPSFPLSSLLYTDISYIWLNTLYISHMDLWTEDKNMSKTFDVDSVSWWKSLIITIPLLQLPPLITPPPRLQSVCFQ